jgi:hypothetical protein
MASAWGSSWGSAWGSSWGSTVAAVTATAGGPRKIRRFFPIYTDEEEQEVTEIAPKVQRRIVRRAVRAIKGGVFAATQQGARRAVMRELPPAAPRDDPAITALIAIAIEQARLARLEAEQDEDDEDRPPLM